MYTNDYDPQNVPRNLQTAIKSSTCQSTIVEASTELSPPMYALTVHALVYKYADMLGIEALKRLAAQKFLALAPPLCTQAAFAKPLRVMFESTRSDDSYLRQPTVTLCVSKHTELIELNPCIETVEAILEHDPMVWKVAVPLLQGSGSQSGVSTSVKQSRSIVEKINNTKICAGSHGGFGPASLNNLYEVKENGVIFGYCSQQCASRY